MMNMDMIFKPQTHIYFSQKGQEPFLLSLSSKSKKTNFLSNSISKEIQNDFFNNLDEDELITKI